MQHASIAAFCKRASTSSITSARPASLQRKCACGGTRLDGGECEACRAKRLGVTADAQTNASPGYQVAHDFSRIRVGDPGRESLVTRVPVGPAGDAYEQEADRVARELTRASGPARPWRPRGGAATASAGGGVPLPDAARAYFEPRFGQDLGHVRVHTDAPAVRMSRALHAEAFTYGSDIYFNERRFSPESPAGKELLAHELVHTIQQRGAVGRKIQRANGGPTSTPSGGLVSGLFLPPPGDCTWAEHRELQNEVDRACDRETRCTQNDDCATIWERIQFNAECIKARAIINMKCFRGGNIGHNIALANAVLALARCWSVYNNKCKPEVPKVPVPVPEPEKKPVVDKTFMEKMAALTGLTGTALVIYIIVSEGSRLFPPRNLVPVP